MSRCLNISFESEVHCVELEDESFECLETAVKEVILKVTGQSIDVFEIKDEQDLDLSITDDGEFDDFLQAFEDSNQDDSKLACVKVIVEQKYCEYY